MRVTEAAKKLGISERSVYRLINEGVLPATVRPRDRPVLGYELDDGFIINIQKFLASGGMSSSPARVREVVSIRFVK